MVFVTGGTGMLGAYLLHNLLTEGFEVRALRREASNLEYVKMIFESLPGNAKELLNKIEWVVAGITDYLAIEECMKGVEYVFHTAAMVSFDKKDKYNILHTNINGTRTVVNAAQNNGVKKFCHASSIAALGSEKEGDWITEESRRDNNRKTSDYAESKYQSELEVWRAYNEGLDAVIVNPSVIIGAGNWSSGSPALISNISKGFRYFTNGITGYVDVRDVAKIMIMLTMSNINGQRFLVSAENISYKDVLFQIADKLSAKRPDIEVSPLIASVAWRMDFIRSFLLNKPVRITKSTARAAMQKQYYSNRKTKDMLGFEYIPISKSIEDVCAIFLRQKKDEAKI